MQVLGIEELEELMDEIQARVTMANRNGTLEELLTRMGMTDLIAPSYNEGRKDGKIVVLGGSEVNQEHLLITAGKLGIDKNRFEFVLDYDALQKYNYRKLQYSDNYRVILVGPIPHSAKEKGDSGSIISEMEKHQEMYPRIVKMMNGTDLKITKFSFKTALTNLQEENYI